jgi:hypothetical protein
VSETHEHLWRGLTSSPKGIHCDCGARRVPAEIERCASCGHGEDEHRDELQELDYDYRPIGSPYSACEGCLIDDSPNSAHAFEAAVRR